jgi:predicted ATPase/signal transduction histidine kinase
MDPANLSGYQITEQLYAGARTLVYRAIRTSDQRPVVIKLLRNEYPNFNELIGFRNQYTIAKNLDFPTIIQPLTLEVYHNSYALVMEDFGGISLSTYLKTAATDQNQPSNSLSLIEFLNLALQLTDILDYLYQNRVIHKDIKPANILINPETKEIKLIDFSISSLLPRETQEIQNPQVLQGTLAYISPEQTGRMNRGIDYRSDFYSLGITFYELLTGKLPFVSDNPMELVHCHIAKTPPSIISYQSSVVCEEIPQVLADIVMKLIAKNAENRYQSALGLKYDLQKCLIQLKETGKIQRFQIGTRDVCDRFIIPEKLYGRESEVQMLLEAFDRIANGTSELMLVAGFSGIGKTAVVNEVHKPITRQNGYFIKGKFDQFNRNIPFSAFVQAFRDLMGQLLSESDTQLQTWKTQIIQALGDNAQVIIEVIPELERIIGVQQPAPQLSGSAAQNRFNLLFQKFIQVFTQPEHPLVMFLDDLQWADSASLKLMQLLISDSQTGYLLLIGAYRDNEVFAVHPLMLTLDEVSKSGTTVNTITLQTLNQASLNQLVSDTLNCAEMLALPLTKLVAQKTKGNPFFATQFLKVLHQDGLIIFDPKEGNWECDITPVRAAALTDDVVELMVQQLQKLPTETQNVLKLAACIGNQFDLKTLAIVSEQTESDAATALWKALQAGLVIPQNEVYKFYVGQEWQNTNNHTTETVNYRFLHDRVQQATYSLIPDEQKIATHLKIGRLLQQNYLEIEQEEKLFEIVGHLNRGKELINQLEEQTALAKLNLKAGIKARNATAYTTARTYLQTGIAFLEASSWQTQYELTLNLYVAATEVAYLDNDFVDMAAKATLVLQKAQTILDQVKIYEIQIAVYISQSNIAEAIALGCDVLASLGVEFIPDPDDARTGQALQKLSEQLSDHKIEELVNLPRMSDAQIEAAMSLFRMLFTPILQGKPSLLPLLSATMVNLSLEFGNAPASAVGYALHGLVLCAFLGDVKTGYRFGILAVSLLEQLQIRSLHSMTLALFSTFIQHHQEPLRTAILTVKKGYRLGMETGDVLYAGYNSCNYFSCSFFAGVEIENFEPESANYSASMGQAKQFSAQSYLDMGRQTVENLTATVSQIDCLQGSIYDETMMLPKHFQEQEFSAIAAVYIYKLLLAYLFGNYQNASEHARQAHQYLLAVSGFIIVPIFHFYAALTQLALASQKQDIDKILAEVETSQTALHHWAENAPMNYSHRWYLVEAEKYRVIDNKAEAIDLYDRAIFLAKENRFLNEEALANELAAKFYLAWGKEKIAASYMQSAYYCYAKWGAKAKIDDLEKCYPDLLRPILQQAAQTLNPLETLASITTSNFSIHTSTQTSRSSSTSINNALDFAAVIKASQSLSSTIKLDELLHQLTQIILQHSGADCCALILPNDEGQWEVKAIATTDKTELCSEPLENNPNLPLKLIQYVKNTQEVVVIDNLKTDLPVIGEYLKQQQSKSLLCLPILDRGHLRGILYLNNRSTAGVFTSDRILILNFLCAQAAISLENARLYANVQTSEARFQLLAENVPGAIYQFQLSPIGKQSFTYISPVCYELYELLAADIMREAQVLISKIHADDIEQFQESIAISAQTLTPWHFQGRFFTTSGILKWVQGDSRPIKQADGTIVWDGILVDISDRKQAEFIIIEKSQELSEALQNLQQTQLQMIQSEKMSALGNLVAGIAHEINNPIGFVSGNLNEAEKTVQDLVEHLNLYRDRALEPEIADHAENIDLDYIIADLPKMIGSMKVGCDRIKGISTSLRTFSRADTDRPVACNIHDGIDSTLMILKHRLKANENRPEIAVIKDYGDLPPIECYAGQLNQVFMNLLANAIDALDESNQGRDYEDIMNKIMIKTELSIDRQQVIIRIRDNGVGISEQVRSKIFDELFTTKGVGKGTGLGLAIARQIVVEKHGGEIKVNSVLSEGTEFAIALPIQ